MMVQESRELTDHHAQEIWEFKLRICEMRMCMWSSHLLWVFSYKPLWLRQTMLLILIFYDCNNKKTFGSTIWACMQKRQKSHTLCQLPTCHVGLLTNGCLPYIKSHEKYWTTHSISQHTRVRSGATLCSGSSNELPNFKNKFKILFYFIYNIFFVSLIL